MVPLPGGFVTFLFTDIEGSTRLWEREPDLMWAVIARHDQLLDGAIDRHDGVHFKTIGDAFQAAFADPFDALNAVVEAQKLFANETWEGIGPVRVRMALHSGPAHPVDGDYMAPCLNRLSRLLSTGYGGQVLISDLVRRRVEPSLPDGVSLKDLGRHRLRDLLEPERITQVVIAGLPEEFPPLKTLELHPTNLPIQPNPLVGREHEISGIMAMLRQDTIRLVTLTGVGGTGKTRLALQVGAELLDEFQDGVFFIDLAPVADPNMVVPTIASTLGIPESTGTSLRETLFTWLGDRSLLLILDNFEHVVAASADVTGILERCPQVRILATSRAPLRIRAEHVRTIPPLPAPDPRQGLSVAELAEIDAVSLFVQRATGADPTFALTAANAADIATICARLDGIPLAIELAAARIRTISPASLLQRLDHRLEVLTDGAHDLPARQRTLRATIEWSVDLLPADVRKLFSTVAIFTGGFALDAVGAMLQSLGGSQLDPLDGVTALMDQNLIRRVEGGAPRFTMLETVREFGIEQLEHVGRMDEVRRAHATWSVELAETADRHLTGPDQSVWLERLELEHDNLRAALAWTERYQDQDQNLRLSTALARFWLIRSHLTEGRRWLDATVARLEGSISGDMEIGAITGSGHLAYAQGAFGIARDRYEQALKAARTLKLREPEAMLINGLGNIEMATGNLNAAETMYTRSIQLSESLGNQHHQAQALGNLGAVAHCRGETETALARYHDCMKLWHALGNTQGTLLMLQNLLLLLSPFPAYADRARVYGAECLRLSRQLGDRHSEAHTLSGLGIVEHVAGNLDAAWDLHQQSLDIYNELSAPNGIGRATGDLGFVALDRGDLTTARDLLLEALRLKVETTEVDGLAFPLEGLATVAAAEGKPEVAARIFGAAERLREEAQVAMQPEMVQRHERVIADLSRDLGETLAIELARGRDMTLEDLVADVNRQLQVPDHMERAVASSLDMALSDIDALLPGTTGPPVRLDLSPLRKDR